MIRRNRTMRFLSASQTRTMYVHKDEHAHSRNHIHRKASCSNTLTHPLTDTQKKCSDMLKDHIRIISMLLQWHESVFGLIWLTDKTNISVESLHSVVYLCPSGELSLLPISPLLSPSEAVNASRTDGWREHLIRRTRVYAITSKHAT